MIVARLTIFTTRNLPNAEVGHAYRLELQGTGGVPTTNGLGPAVLHHEWALSRGPLPPGLVLKNGAVSGSPTRSGSYAVPTPSSRWPGRPGGRELPPDGGAMTAGQFGCRALGPMPDPAGPLSPYLSCGGGMIRPVLRRAPLELVCAPASARIGAGGGTAREFLRSTADEVRPRSIGLEVCAGQARDAGAGTTELHRT